ncbi:MAG: hypothetical protein ABJB11_08235 [Ferruginibacter sp.]
MDKLTFQQLNFLCDLNVDKKYVKDCIQILKHQDCIFETGIIMPHDHIASLYNARFNNAKEGGKLTIDNLTDYENCVDRVNKSKSKFLGITSVFSDQNSFLIFYEPDNKIILGVLKSKNSSDIKDIEESATDSKKLGYSSSTEKYSKGIFIRNWK